MWRMACPAKWAQRLCWGIFGWVMEKTSRIWYTIFLKAYNAGQYRLGMAHCANTGEGMGLSRKRVAMKRSFSACLLAVFLCLALPGCSFTGFSAQNLMSPPKINGDQQSICRLLQGPQAELLFIYPRSGEYRSAIIMEDFTGDGTEDAIGFHQLEDNRVEVQFLVKEGGAWKTAAAFTNPATQVDRVCFGNLGPGGQKGALIGWGSAAGATGRTAEVRAYLFQEGEVQEYLLGVYGEMALTDFDGDGIDEVFTVDKYLPAPEEGVDPVPAQAKVYTFKGGAPLEAAAVPADNSIATYSSVTFGSLTGETRGVVVDGATADGSMTTQVFVMEEGALRNYPEGVNQEGYVNPYARPASASFSSRDINGDGLIELPVVTRLPGLPEDTPLDSTSYQVEWDIFEEGGGRRMVLFALMNLRENYWFTIPFSLQGTISASNDPARRTVTYTQVVQGQDGASLLGKSLFTLRVFTQSAWESRGEGSGYELLAVQNDSVYGIQQLTKDDSLQRPIRWARETFRLM